jgi:4-oxalocrotonate tautomerase
MPTLRVQWLQGRSEEQRHQLAGKITEAFVQVIGLKPDEVNIIFEEISPSMQYKGGVPWSERGSIPGKR